MLPHQIIALIGVFILTAILGLNIFEKDHGNKDFKEVVIENLKRYTICLFVLFIAVKIFDYVLLI